MIETLSITIDDEVIELRPTLAAATTLHRLHGMPEVINGISELSVTTIRSIARSCNNRLTEKGVELVARYFLTTKDTDTLKRLAHSFVGVDPFDEEFQNAQEAKSEPPSWDTIYRDLYRYGTGWLGWSPADTWNATPREIAEAVSGRSDMLNKLFGGSSAEKTTKARTPEAIEATMVTWLQKAAARGDD